MSHRLDRARPHRTQVDSPDRSTRTGKPVTNAPGNPHQRDTFEAASEAGRLVSKDPDGRSRKGFLLQVDPAGRTVVNLGDGNDRATVRQLRDGRIRISSGGERLTLNAEQSRRVTLSGGNGDDKIVVRGRVTSDLALDGGRGDDNLRGGDGNETFVGGSGHDRLVGGGGKDLLSGGAGDDYISGGGGSDVAVGGSGKDVIYGLGGKDLLVGGKDQDYVDGGRGNDVVAGAEGNDALIGGWGNDTLVGGDGRDVQAGGHGRDTLDGGEGADRNFAQRNDQVTRGEGDRTRTVGLSSAGKRLEVRGSKEFRARVQSDLEAFRSLPEGQALLRELDRSRRRVTIRESNAGSTAGWDGKHAFRNFNTGRPGKGSDVKVTYNIEDVRLGNEDFFRLPPIAIFAHELTHAREAAHGILPLGKTDQDNPAYPGPVFNFERSASGLPYDHDEDPRTPLVNPSGPNENTIRRQLGLPPRRYY
jgi:hypothetical protein